MQVEEECDLVGPWRRAVLRRHGYLWRPDAHLWTPLLDLAFGGSLLTGVGYSRAPGGVPAFVFRDFRPLSWLRPSARRDVPGTLDGGRRASTEGPARPRMVAKASSGPCSDRPSPANGRDATGRTLSIHFSTQESWRLSRRSPSALRLSPCSSRVYDAPSAPTAWATALWGPASRELAADWRGEDVDQNLVDIGALAREWSLPQPDPRTYLLMQSIALERERRVAADVAVAGLM